jgi:hypothetical protein
MKLRIFRPWEPTRPMRVSASAAVDAPPPVEIILRRSLRVCRADRHQGRRVETAWLFAQPGRRRLRRGGEAVATMTDAARQLLAVAESVGPSLTDEQAQRAIRNLLAIAGEGSDRAIAVEQRQLAQGRQDRELGRHEVAGGGR